MAATPGRSTRTSRRRTDASGEFTYTIDAGPGHGGTYDISATDGTCTATTQVTAVETAGGVNPGGIDRSAPAGHGTLGGPSRQAASCPSPMARTGRGGEGRGGRDRAATVESQRAPRYDDGFAAASSAPSRAASIERDLPVEHSTRIQRATRPPVETTAGRSPAQRAPGRAPARVMHSSSHGGNHGDSGKRPFRPRRTDPHESGRLPEAARPLHDRNGSERPAYSI